MFFEQGPDRFAASPRATRERQRRRRGGRDHGDGGGGGWSRLFGERPQRADRGGVRYLVLDAVAEEARHGYEIMQVIETRSLGAYRPSPGVIYPTLQLLDELGHVRVTEREEKKVYAITPAGTGDLEQHRDEVVGFYERCQDESSDHDDDLRDVMLRVRRLLKAFRRSARRGRLTPAVIAQVRAALDGVASKLESLIEE